MKEKEILCHPHIPKPLHGLNPRTLMGEEWWNYHRHIAYARYDYRCIGCGKHKASVPGPKWLEAHENYEYDYEKGRAHIISIEPVCHYCHNFIHTGRLQMIMGKEKTVDEVKAILQYGFDVLKGSGLQVFPFTMDFAHDLKVKTYDVDAYEIPISTVPWEDWRLIVDGVEYKPLFASHDEWRKKYSG
jgi:hypothetical protein